MSINANQYKPIYDLLKIDVNNLGCVMMKLPAPPDLVDYVKHVDGLYTSPDPNKFWIVGNSALKNPHITLLYGLLKPAYGEFRRFVDYVLEGWKCKELEVDKIDFFDSPFADEPYYCIVAKFKVTPLLQEGFDRLSLLPHVNTTGGVYRPHCTIMYLDKRKGEKYRDKIMADLSKMLVGKVCPTGELDYGKDKKK